MSDSKKIKWSKCLCKKNLIILLILIVLISGLVVITNSIQNANNEARFKGNDMMRAEKIKKALLGYIIDTNDIMLTFGRNKGVRDVNEILHILQKPIEFNGKTFGPYLDEKKNDYPRQEGNKGWEIVINKSNQEIDVKPSKEGNSIQFVD